MYKTEQGKDNQSRKKKEKEEKKPTNPEQHIVTNGSYKLFCFAKATENSLTLFQGVWGA